MADMFHRHGTISLMTTSGILKPRYLMSGLEREGHALVIATGNGKRGVDIGPAVASGNIVREVGKENQDENMTNVTLGSHEAIEGRVTVNESVRGNTGVADTKLSILVYIVLCKYRVCSIVSLLLCWIYMICSHNFRHVFVYFIFLLASIIVHFYLYVIMVLFSRLVKC